MTSINQGLLFFLHMSYSVSWEKYLSSYAHRGLTCWSNNPDVVGSIPVTTEYFLISCDSNQVPKWFGTQYNLEVPL